MGAFLAFSKPPTAPHETDLQRKIQPNGHFNQLPRVTSSLTEPKAQLLAAHVQHNFLYNLEANSSAVIHRPPRINELDTDSPISSPVLSISSQNLSCFSYPTTVPIFTKPFSGRSNLFACALHDHCSL